MQNVRKPRPVVPETLRELVIDLDQRLEGGDGVSVESDVWLPGADWTRLVTLAHADGQRPVLVGSSSAAAAAQAVFAQRDATELAEVRESLRAAVAALDQQRGALAHVLGAGVDTDFADCLEIARGYAMALDAERERAVQRLAEIVAERKASAPEPEHPRECRTCGGAPYLVMVDGKLRAGHYTDRETAISWARDAMRFEAFSIVDASGELFDRFAKCGVCQKVTDGHVTAACPSASGEEQEPEHPECPHCGEADGHAPKDCAVLESSKEQFDEQSDDDRPTMVEAAERARTEELIHAAGRRLRGSAWRRSAVEARRLNLPGVCHHCGSHDDKDDDLKASDGGQLPAGTFCAGCRMRLMENPSEWQRHFEEKPKRASRKAKQVTLEEAVAAASPKPRPPGRATRKFPRGGTDMSEKCTRCGAELGAHDGTKCPRAALQRGTVAIHDEREGATV